MSTAAVVAKLAWLLVTGELELPIAAAYLLSEGRATFAELERGHTRGAVEDVTATHARVVESVEQETTPANRSEAEIAGCRVVLDTSTRARSRSRSN
jgi:hypothetical protein